MIWREEIPVLRETHMPREVWTWRGIHFVLVALLPLILVFLAGCKVAKETTEDLGPAFTDEQVDEALNKAIEGYTFRYIHVGQFVHYDMNRRLENQETTINLGNLDVRIKAIKDQEPGDDPNSITFIVKAEQNDRNASGGFDTKITEEPLTLIYSPSLSDALKVSALDAMRSTASAARVTTASLRSQAGAMASQPVTYHHLKTFTTEMDVPEKVRETADCGGIPNCKLRVNFIQVQMVVWKSESSYQKYALDLAFSPDMPYIPFGDGMDQLNGLMVQNCQSTYVPIEKRTVYVRDCLILDDFRRNELVTP
jgi:hypothetical protein